MYRDCYFYNGLDDFRLLRRRPPTQVIPWPTRTSTKLRPKAHNAFRRTPDAHAPLHARGGPDGQQACRDRRPAVEGHRRCDDRCDARRAAHCCDGEEPLLARAKGEEGGRAGQGAQQVRPVRPAQEGPRLLRRQEPHHQQQGRGHAGDDAHPAAAAARLRDSPQSFAARMALGQARQKHRARKRLSPKPQNPLHMKICDMIQMSKI